MDFSIKYSNKRIQKRVTYFSKRTRYSRAQNTREIPYSLSKIRMEIPTKNKGKSLIIPGGGVNFGKNFYKRNPFKNE